MKPVTPPPGPAATDAPDHPPPESTALKASGNGEDLPTEDRWLDPFGVEPVGGPDA